MFVILVWLSTVRVINWFANKDIAAFDYYCYFMATHLFYISGREVDKSQSKLLSFPTSLMNKKKKKKQQQQQQQQQHQNQQNMIEDKINRDWGGCDNRAKCERGHHSTVTIQSGNKAALSTNLVFWLWFLRTEQRQYSRKQGNSTLQLVYIFNSHLLQLISSLLVSNICTNTQRNASDAMMRSQNPSERMQPLMKHTLLNLNNNNKTRNSNAKRVLLRHFRFPIYIDILIGHQF